MAIIDSVRVLHHSIILLQGRLQSGQLLFCQQTPAIKAQLTRRLKSGCSSPYNDVAILIESCFHFRAHLKAHG